jgi:hypothetical protein
MRRAGVDVIEMARGQEGVDGALELEEPLGILDR